MNNLSLIIRADTLFFFFFFNDTATTEIYTLSLHDALPIWARWNRWAARADDQVSRPGWSSSADRKSTRLNSSHLVISYAVFCLKKKKSHRHSVCSHMNDDDLVTIIYGPVHKQPKLQLMGVI